MIGMFDSGVGGLSILNEVVKIFPNENIMYLADQKNIPYSTKTTTFLKQRASQIVDYLISKGASTIVIACNTATVAAISYLRKTYPKTSFVGVEPAIKPAVTYAKNGKVLILATKSTLQSIRLQQLVEEYQGESKLLYQDMPEWVSLVESGDVKSKRVVEKVEKSLLPFKDSSINSVVLACTHYPFLKEIIAKKIKNARIFDPSIAVATQTRKVHKTEVVKNPAVVLITTGRKKAFQRTVTNLRGDTATVQSISL